jgi:predicted nuclease of predicted toxin-antitoxin system
VISFLVDQNFNEHIVDGLTRRDATLEFIHVRDVGLAAAPDPTILEWAAAHALVLLTHDRKTIPQFAYARVTAGLPMPGVFLVSDDMPIGHAVEELLIAAHCLTPEECKDIVEYFPM